MPFLTAIDPRAAIKSSRDPLGIQPVWASFGRAVVGNLTTVTTSVRNFTTMLIGLYLTDRAIESGALREEDRVDAFLKFEQLAAYSRYACGEKSGENDESPRGINRVMNRVDQRRALVISAAQEHQILSAQKTYGLWGLFTVASRQSGLIEHRENHLTERATSFVEREYLPRLGSGSRSIGNEIIRFLVAERRSFSPSGQQKELARTLFEILQPSYTTTERAFYMESLLLGSSPGNDVTNGRQARLWNAIVEANEKGPADWSEPFDYRELLAVRAIADRNDDDDLVRSLDAILTVEPLLAAASSLFSFILQRDRGSLDDIATELRRQWGDGLSHLRIDRLAALRTAIADVGGETLSTNLQRLAIELHGGAYESAIGTAVHDNKHVMTQRGGAPWVVIEKGKVEVRLREQPATLPERDELPWLWQNTYFINSLKSIGRALHHHDRR